MLKHFSNFQLPIPKVQFYLSFFVHDPIRIRHTIVYNKNATYPHIWRIYHFYILLSLFSFHSIQNSKKYHFGLNFLITCWWKEKKRLLCPGQPRHIYMLTFFPRPVKNSLSTRKLISRNTFAIYLVFLYFGICRYEAFFFIVLCLASSTVSFSLVHLFGNFPLTIKRLIVLLERYSL